MSDCQCDDDMTEDGHGSKCPNGITVLRAEVARLTAERDAELLAVAERVRRCCLSLVDSNDGGREYVMSDIRAIDLTAIIKERKP